MTINATWVLGTILILLLQIGFVAWQRRYLRSFDRISAPGGQRPAAAPDPSADADSYA
jgi:hypothetical protein